MTEVQETIINNWKQAFAKCNGKNGFKTPEVTYVEDAYKITSTSIFGNTEILYHNEEKMVKLTSNLLERCK